MCITIICNENVIESKECQIGAFSLMLSDFWSPLYSPQLNISVKECLMLSIIIHMAYFAVDCVCVSFFFSIMKPCPSECTSRELYLQQAGLWWCWAALAQGRAGCLYSCWSLVHAGMEQNCRSCNVEFYTRRVENRTTLSQSVPCSACCP